MIEKHLLVIDDDYDFADGLAALLRSVGFEVSVAYSGEDAVGESAETAYDAIFMDVMLAGMNGIDAMAAIRRNRPKARVVLMSGYDASQFAEAARCYGATATLQKPLGLECIREVLDEAGEPIAAG